MHTVDEPGRVPSGILALLVHLLFFGMLVFGISWQKKVVGPVVVDLWEELPEPVRKVSAPPKIVETPPKPAPEVKKGAAASAASAAEGGGAAQTLARRDRVAGKAAQAEGRRGSQTPGGEKSARRGEAPPG